MEPFPTPPAARPPPEARLLALRAQLVAIEDHLIDLLGERQLCCARIGRLKRQLGEPMIQPQYAGQTLQRAMDAATRHGLDAWVVRALSCGCCRKTFDWKNWPGRRGLVRWTAQRNKGGGRRPGDIRGAVHRAGTCPLRRCPDETPRSDRQAQTGNVPGSRMLLSTVRISVWPQKAMVTSSSLWISCSALVTPASPIAPRP